MVDWVLLAIVAVSALFGLMRGFVGVAVSLAAWMLAGWAAFRFGGEVSQFFASQGEPSMTHVLGGYALSFLAVLVVVGLVGWLMRMLIASVGLTGLDRSFGLALGLVRGGFVACALVLLMGLTTLPREPSWHASSVIPVLIPGARWLATWLPEWVQARVDFGVAGPISAPSDTESLSTPLPAPVGA